MATPATTPFDGKLEAFGEDGTLFTGTYDQAAAGYLIVSRTPIEDNEPLVLKQFISRGEATKFREENWIKGHSINSAAMHLGRVALELKIPTEIRRFKNGVVAQQELETLDGFGSF